MILSDTTTPSNGLIQQAHIAYKNNNKWPASGTDNFIRYMAIANRLKDQWAKDAHIFWNSLFEVRTYGPIVSSIQTYDFDDDVFSPSDSIFINRTDGNQDEFQVLHPNLRNSASVTGSGKDAVYITGIPGALAMNFVTPFTQLTQDVGGTIEAGVYFIPPDYVNDTDDIIIDNTQWMVYALAAELARNDPAKQDQFPTLLGTANDLYSKMIAFNQGNSFQQPNGPAYKVTNPGITWTEY